MSVSSAAPASAVERLVVSMAKEIEPDDVVVVGVGTPVALAAVLLARELHAPRVGIMMPGARNPLRRDLSEYIVNPAAAVTPADARVSRMQILDAIRAGVVSLQFVRPAEVDGDLRINTELLATRDGIRLLVGPVALPDVVQLVGRVIAYLPKHDSSVLVRRVATVTAPRPPTRRGVVKVVTPLATIARDGEGTYTIHYTPSSTPESLQEMTGFDLHPAEFEMSAAVTERELAVLRQVVDPAGMTRLEDPSTRRQGIEALTEAWRGQAMGQGGASP